MDFIADNLAVLIFAMVGMWFAQFFMANRQMRAFYKRLAQIRKNGLTAVGMAGGQYKGRSYAVLTIDENDRVVHAEQFSGWTVFATLKPVPEMVGLPLREVLDNQSSLPVSKKLQTAFANAAKDLQAAREKDPVTLAGPTCLN